MSKTWKQKAISISLVIGVTGIMLFDASSSTRDTLPLAEQKVALTDTIYEPENELELLKEFDENSEQLSDTTNEEYPEMQDIDSNLFSDELNNEALQPEEALNYETSPVTDTVESDAEANLERFRSTWKTGCYNYATAKYESYPASRICHRSYDPVVSGATYQVILSNPDFHMLIRELDENSNFIKSSDLEGGTEITLSTQTAYVAISLYPPSIKNVTFTTYKKLFTDGMIADFVFQAERKDEPANNELNIESVPAKENETAPQIPAPSFRETWKTGCYNYATAKYESYPASRICHRSYDPVVSGATYQVVLSNPDFHMLIRELDENNNFIKSSDLEGGKEVTLSAQTAYVAISLYPPSIKNVTFSTFEELFANGMTADFVLLPAKETEPENNINAEVPPIVETEMSNKTPSKPLKETWKTGCYNYATAKYEPYPSSRICHKSYDPVVSGATYQVILSNPDFHMLIRELDENYKFIASSNLAGGEELTLSPQTAYVAIGLYPPSLKNVTFKTYEELFSQGMLVGFEQKQLETVPVLSFEEVIGNLIEKGDTNSIDVSQYQLKDTEALDLFRSLIDEKYYLLNKCSSNLSLSMNCDANGYVKSIALSNYGTETIEKCKKLTPIIEEALSKITSEMSETEKALILHDYLLDIITYFYEPENPGYQAYTALVEGNAICQGYADSLVTLFHEAGIESVLVDGNDEHHSWVLVKLDGQYYHIDPTWDDLQSNYRHFYFLRSDKQFMSPDKGDAHFAWTSENNSTADSDRFDNWFIHDVVGNVVYYNGYWYFANGNSLKRAKIDGTSMETVATEKEKINILSSNASGVKYSVGAETKNYY